jgi:hypothetical protein
MERIRNHLQTLKMKRMEKELDNQLAMALKEKLSPSVFLERMLALEANDLLQRRIERRI